MTLMYMHLCTVFIRHRLPIGPAPEDNQLKLRFAVNSGYIFQTADSEADVWMTLRSIGVPKPQHVYTNHQLELLEGRYC